MRGIGQIVYFQTNPGKILKQFSITDHCMKVSIHDEWGIHGILIRLIY